MSARKGLFSRNALFLLFFFNLPCLFVSLAGGDEGRQAQKPVLRRNAFPLAPRCTERILQSNEIKTLAKTRQIYSEEWAEDLEMRGAYGASTLFAGFLASSFKTSKRPRTVVGPAPRSQTSARAPHARGYGIRSPAPFLTLAHPPLVPASAHFPLPASDWSQLTSLLARPRPRAPSLAAGAGTRRPWGEEAR